MNAAQNHLGCERRVAADPFLDEGRPRNMLCALTVLAIVWASGSAFAAEPTAMPTAQAEAAKAEATKPDTAKPEAAKPTSAAKPAAQADASKNAAGQSAAQGDAAQRPATENKSQPASSAADEEALPPPPDSKAPSPQRFVPSEQVRADFDVSFPIDI